MKIAGGTKLAVRLPPAKERDNFYCDTAVVAFRLKKSPSHAPLKNWKQKALQESLAPDSSPLFAEISATPGEQDADATEVVDLTARLGDASLPPEQRLTQTNIRKLTAQTPLEPAGLFGPVQLLQQRSPK